MTDIPEPEQILVGLRAAIAETLDGVDLARIDINTVHAGTPMLSLPVDSLALMQIVTSVEDRFRVYIPEDKAYAFTTIGELVDFVHEKTIAKASRQRDSA
jgi:acyl carrier protein